ncbi:MAG: tautomerase family protein [Pseudomonadales bacterium]|nr:tautomerase family protein [Pseudomonadales bacterium]
MPFTRIAIPSGKPAAFQQQLSRILHHNLVTHFGVPADDCFQLIDQYDAGSRIFDRHYLTGTRSDEFVLFQITAGRPRSTDQKRALYQGLAKQLHDELGLSPDDVMVVIQFTASEDWSFGGGRMFELASLPGTSW